MPFQEEGTKQGAVDRIADTLVMPRVLNSRGSTEPAEIFYAAARRLGLPVTGGKPAIAEEIARLAGLEWEADFDSRGTQSGGGGTVTLKGLNRVLEALELLLVVAPASSPNVSLGAPYRSASGGIAQREAQVLKQDLSALDAATRLHADTQNEAAEVVRAHGLKPLSPESGQPLFDLAWNGGSGLVLAEIKGIADSNRRQQIRLALGQVLDYRYTLSGQVTQTVHAAIVLSHPPHPDERAFCRSAGVTLTSLETMSADLSAYLKA